MAANIVLGPGWNTFSPSFCNIELTFLNIPTAAPPPGTLGGKLSLVDCKRVSYSEHQHIEFLYGVTNTPLARTGRVTKALAEIEWGLTTFEAIAYFLGTLQQKASTSVSIAPSQIEIEGASVPVVGQGLTIGSSAAPASPAVQFGGFGDVEFDLSIVYQIKPGSAFLRDILYACRIEGPNLNSQVSGREVTAGVTLSVASIGWAISGSTQAGGSSLVGSNGSGVRLTAPSILNGVRQGTTF